MDNLKPLASINPHAREMSMRPTVANPLLLGAHPQGRKRSSIGMASTTLPLRMQLNLFKAADNKPTKRTGIPSSKRVWRNTSKALSEGWQDAPNILDKRYLAALSAAKDVLDDMDWETKKKKLIRRSLMTKAQERHRQRMQRQAENDAELYRLWDIMLKGTGTMAYPEDVYIGILRNLRMPVPKHFRQWKPREYRMPGTYVPQVRGDPRDPRGKERHFKPLKHELDMESSQEGLAENGSKRRFSRRKSIFPGATKMKPRIVRAAAAAAAEDTSDGSTE